MTSALVSNDPALAAFAELVGDDGPVTVRGSGTRWELGGLVDPEATVVSAPVGVVDHIPAEMTVTVRAGTTVAQLQEVLGGAGQRTALPGRGGTVGGAVAVGENGLYPRGTGTVAASVLQVRYVSAEGRLVTAGGPTVKNVTGFDLPRLMTGSLGTLGLLAEITLRTNPIPGLSCWLEAEAVDPFAVNDLLLHPSAVLADDARVWVLLEGHAADVEAESRRLATLGTFVERDGPPPLPEHRWSLPPAALRDVVAGAADGATGPEPGSGPFVASIGVGHLWASQPQPPRPLDPVTQSINGRLKSNFDPTGRLNPGRTLGRP